MDSQIEEIKAKTDIAQLIGQYVTLSRAGRNLKGLCPFHSERSPSFMVSPERGTYRCFGCGEHGDAISFLEKYENLSFPEALEQLATKAGIELQRSNFNDKDKQDKQRLFDLLHLSAEYFHFVLTQHSLGKEGREYLSKRQVSQETINKYKLGLAPNSWQSLGDFLHKKGFNPSEIANVGLNSQNDRGKQFDKFRGRLMFPVTDSLSRVVGFSGRTMLGDESGPKYLNSPDTPLFHKGRLLYGLAQAKEGIRQHDRLILVEGNVDVLSSAQAGSTEVVAPLGTALTPEQANVIKKYTQNVYISFDGDNAGQVALRRAIPLLRQADLNIKVIQLPAGQDPDSLIKQDPKLWTEAIEQATDVVDYYLNWLTTGFDLKTEQSKRLAAQEIAPLIQATIDPVSRAFLLQKAASALLIDEAALAKVASQAQAQVPSSPPNVTLEAKPQIKAKVKYGREDLLMRFLISTILTISPDDVSAADLQQVLKALSKDAVPELYRTLYAAITKQLNQQQELQLINLESGLSNEDVDLFDELSLIDPSFNAEGTSLTNPDRIGAASSGMEAAPSDPLISLADVIRQLNQLHLKEQLNQLSRSLKQAEAMGKDATDTKKEYTQIVRKLAQSEKKYSK